MLGICYGMQLLTRELGGEVQGAEVGEFGRSQLTVTEPGRLLAGLPREQTCWMSHRDTVFAPPPGFTALASSSESPVAALESVERGIYGIQFHPEVVHTPYGQDILTRFLEDICGCERTWSAGSMIDDQIARIRAQVGDGRVICGLSGGVDSSRRGAARAPRDRRPAHVRVRRPRPDAQERGRAGHLRLPRPLQGPARGGRRRGPLPRRGSTGVTEPEAKRKAIGEEFIRVFEEEAAKLAAEAGAARATSCRARSTPT